MKYSVLKGRLNVRGSSSIKEYSIWQNFNIFRSTVFFNSDIYP